MITMINKLRIYNSLFRTMKIKQEFSLFKTKFEVIKQNLHTSITEMYYDMNKFENNLEYLQKLKYKKAVENLHKKITKLYKKQQASLNTTTQQQQSKPNHILKLPFNTSISHQIFYYIENQQYKPIDDQGMLNKISLNELYNIAVEDGSMFYRDFDLATKMILSNPSNNGELYQLVQERCGYFQDHFAMGVYENYDDILKQAEEAESMGKGNSLKRLKGVKSKQKIFTKDFKFTLKTISPEQNYKASEIAKILTKYGFSSQKVRTFALKSLSNEGYKSLTPQSLKNHLFVLGYHKTSITELNQNLFKLFDIVNQLSDKDQSLEFMGEMGPLNSLLFYMLSNKIEIYEIIRSILKKLIEKQIKYNLDKDGENRNRNQQQIHIIDREIFSLMIRLVKSKFQISLEELRKQLNWDKKYTSFMNPDQILKKEGEVSTNSCEDFERYLLKKRYKFEKSIYSPTSQEYLFQIQDRSFLCLNLSRLNIKMQKLNGIGQLILQPFKHKGQKIKNINPIMVNKCQKWTQKQQYFKSKLKGLQEPQSIRERRFDF